MKQVVVQSFGLAASQLLYKASPADRSAADLATAECRARANAKETEVIMVSVVVVLAVERVLSQLLTMTSTYAFNSFFQRQHHVCSTAYSTDVQVTYQ